MEISYSDISGITTKAPCEVALMGKRHVRIEISDFVMRTFVLIKEISFSIPSLDKRTYAWTGRIFAIFHKKIKTVDKREKLM